MLHVGKNNVFVSFLPVMNPASLLQRKTPAAATSATSPIFPNIWNFAAMSSHLSRRPSRKKLSKAAATEIKKENELQVRSYCKRGSLFLSSSFRTIWKKAPAHPPSQLKFWHSGNSLTLQMQNLDWCAIAWDKHFQLIDFSFYFRKSQFSGKLS